MLLDKHLVPVGNFFQDLDESPAEFVSLVGFLFKFLKIDLNELGLGIPNGKV